MILYLLYKSVFQAFSLPLGMDKAFFTTCALIFFQLTGYFHPAHPPYAVDAILIFRILNPPLDNGTLKDDTPSSWVLCLIVFQRHAKPKVKKLENRKNHIICLFSIFL